MNLVQINERLKDLPMQVVQQYANGMNPEVPPYLALGELQRRELSQKQMATAQGGAQGPQPSVKEQVEQKAGLMALQQMQQQQTQQQQPRGPMPVPAGVPQPQAQPQAPMMAARGGLATIPVRKDMFEYARGGIIAFAEGGSAKDKPLDAKAQAALDEAQRSGDRNAILMTLKKLGAAGYDVATLIPRAFMGVAEDVSNTRLGRALGVDFELPQSAYGGDRKSMTPMMDRVQRQEEGVLPVAQNLASSTPQAPRLPVSESQATMKAGPQAAVPVSGVKVAAEAKGSPRPPMAPPAAPQGGLPGAAAAMTPQNEISKLALDAVRAPAKAMTPEEAMAQEGKFASQYGLDKKFGEEERGLLALMKQRQADYAQRRPMEELGATLRGFGQGYGGASAAGERAGRETYEMDMANQREALNAVNALNKENLATGKARYASSSNLFGEDQKSTSAANRERMQSLAQLAGVDERRIQSELDRMTQVQIQKMKDAAAKLERTSPGKAERMLAEVLSLRAAGKNKEADMIIETINAIEGRAGKEDTFTKKMEAERVRIAGSMMTPEMKKKALDDLDALEKRGGGAAAQTGKVPPPPPGFKLN